MLPNFVHVGTPKSGSGTISRVLRRHPQVYTPRPKELNFFNTAADYSKGVDWYEESYYAEYDGQKIACDNSIGYSAGAFEETLARIAQTLGTDIKVLITVRHPVDRAYSNYCMARYKGQFEHLGFADAVRDALAIEGRFDIGDVRSLERGDYYSDTRSMSIFRNSYYIVPSLYFTLIERCVKIFGNDNVLVLFTEDMAGDLGGQIDRLTEFLGVDPIDVAPGFRANEATSLRFPSLRRVYNAAFSYVPLRNWYNGLGQSMRRSVRKSLMSWNYRRNEAVPPADPLGQAILQKRFHAEMESLQMLSGRDLSHWLNKYPIPDRSE